MDKEELRNIINLDDRIDSKLRQLEELRSTATCISGIDYSKDRVQTSNVSSATEKMVTQIIDLEEDITEDIQKLVNIKKRAKKEINCITGIHGIVLEMRYLENMKWEEIAYRLNYSISSIYKIHGQALNALKKMN